MNYKIDKEAKGKPYEGWLTEMCKTLADEVEPACPGHTLICSGGPYRGYDAKVKYFPKKKELSVDFYSVVRRDDREIHAYNYAKGIIKEACLTSNHLKKKYPDTWEAKWEEWRQGMLKLSEEEQKDIMRDLIKDRE